VTEAGGTQSPARAAGIFRETPVGRTSVPFVYLSPVPPRSATIGGVGEDEKEDEMWQV